MASERDVQPTPASPHTSETPQSSWRLGGLAREKQRRDGHRPLDEPIAHPPGQVAQRRQELGRCAGAGDFQTVGIGAGRPAYLHVAAIVGDTVNYHVGKAIGPRVMKSETSRIFNKKHLEKTRKFFDKYGAKTIILCRFVPIVRTFAPFVAGAGAMNYGKFITYNIIGAVAWVVLMMGAGVLFGQLEVVRKNFELVVIGIVVLSVMPMVIEWWKSRGKKEDDDVKAPAAEAEPAAAKD